MSNGRPTKRERIDAWIRSKEVGFKFYARQVARACKLETMEVSVYLKWHNSVERIGESMNGPNWVVVKGAKSAS